MKKHKIIKQTKIINLQEWAIYLKVSRHTVKKRINQYTINGHHYNPHNIYSVLDLATFLSSFKKPS